VDSGVRKKPSVERGPKAMIAIRQPKPMTSDGVRQVVGTAPDCERLNRLLALVIVARSRDRLRKAEQHKTRDRIAQTKIAGRWIGRRMAGPPPWRMGLLSCPTLDHRF